MDLARLQSAPLGGPGNLSLLRIDGLCAEGRMLIAIHNGYTSTQVVRYHLDAGLSQVEHMEILERKDPSWKLPNIGAIAEGRFYFRANSQIGGPCQDKGFEERVLGTEILPWSEVVVAAWSTRPGSRSNPKRSSEVWITSVFCGSKAVGGLPRS